MISRSLKVLSAAAVAAALIGTVAVSRTIHLRTDASDAQPAPASAMKEAAGDLTQSPLRELIACGTLSYSDCEKLEMILPE